MNLKEIREMIGSIIDYDPEIPSYKNEVHKIVNQCYLEFFCEHPWKFNQKSVDVYTKPAVTDTATITISAQDQNYPDGTIELDTNTITRQDDRGGQIRREGDVLKLTGSAEDENNGLYIIDKIDPTDHTTVQVSKYAQQNRVKWQGSVGAEDVNVSIQQRYLTLPEDCISILSVGIRNLAEAGVGTNAIGHAYPLVRRDEEELNLRDDITGTPFAWIPYDQPPDTVSRNVRDYIPRAGKDFTVTTDTASGGWYAGTYEFAIAYELHGQVGPMSDPIELTLTSNQRPSFSLIDTTKLGFFGLRKRFFFRIKSAVGKDGATFEEPYFRSLSDFIIYPAGADFLNYMAEDTATTYLPNHQATNYVLDTLDGLLAVPRAKPTLDNRWRIKLHPRPTTQTPMRIRYQFYPGELLDDYDTPQSPVDTHRYLVYRSCQELFIKHKNPDMALYYEKKADDEMRKCEKRYLTERSQYYVKEGFRSGPTRFRPFRNLTKTVGADGS